MVGVNNRGLELIPEYEELYLPNLNALDYSGNVPISDSFYQLFDKENDARWIHFYNDYKTLDFASGILHTIEVEGQTVRNCIKWSDQQWLKPAWCHTYSRFYYGTCSIIGMTTAEMYLIKAECLARSGKTGEAAELLKMLRRTRFMNENAANNIGGNVQDILDELDPIARLSGHPALSRVSIFHALNQKVIARTYAREVGKKYEEMNLIVAHMGGGVSVGAHCCGRVVDVNNALDGDGPFSPERSGGLPTGALVELCFSGKSKAEVKKMLKGNGGVVAYLGTNDMRLVEEKAPVDAEYGMIQDAMCYQIGKEIGAMAAVLKGKVDAILLTGGIAYGKPITDYITRMVGFIAPVKVYPGEDEMRALAMNGLMVLRGEMQAKTYA